MTTGTHAFIALLWWFVMRCSGDQDHARDHVMSDSVRAACLRKDETACSVLRSEVQYNTTNLRLNGCLNSHSTTSLYKSTCTLARRTLLCARVIMIMIVEKEIEIDVVWVV